MVAPIVQLWTLIQGSGSVQLMKPTVKTFAAMALASGLMACDGSDGKAEAGSEANPPIASQATDGAITPTSGTPVNGTSPAFAVIYPGAELSQPPVVADGADGPGGLAEFQTSASADDVVAFYRKLAEDNGLNPVMSMNQGDARAFAALNNKGAELQVIASSVEEGKTSVQLSWKTGQN